MFIKEYSKTKSVKLITRLNFEAFIEHEQDRGLKASTVKLRLRTVNAFLSYLIDNEILRPEAQQPPFLP